MRHHVWTLALGSLLAAGCAKADTEAPAETKQTSAQPTVSLEIDGMT